MPLYKFQCNKCEHTWEDILLLKNRDKPCKSPCPNCKEKKCVVRPYPTPSFSEPHKIGMKRPDQGFREVISKIKQHHPKNTIRDY